MTEFKPFANDSQAATLGELTIENGTSAIAIHGSLDITHDKAGLGRAQQLKQHLDAVVAILLAAPNLPDAVAPPEAPQVVKNPFK